MPLRLYNSFSKREEDFVPLLKSSDAIKQLSETLGSSIPDPAKVVTMYTCGPTVYGRPHIGNYSSFLMADLLRRWLTYGHGFTVIHVKNITDVGHLLHDSDHGDDKIQKQAEKEQVHPLDIARKYTGQFLEDERALCILEPAARPKASDYIPHMKAMIDVLLQKKSAYITDDGIYFSVATFPQYGALSGNTVSSLDAGARVSIDEKKKHPADFALWKFCVGDNAHHILRWPSPGGIPTEGFPGWHIECSAMSSALLGDQIDLHTGGEDNIFPHHECEIAQSETATGKQPFVRLWLHKRRIDLGGEKMSKSLGNVRSLPDIVADGYSPLDLRYLFLCVHYRTNLKFTSKALDDARTARRRIMQWMHDVDAAPRAIDNPEIQKSISSLHEAMNSDLNTPAALAIIFETMGWSRSNNALGACTPFTALVRDTFGCFASEDRSVPVEVQRLVEERQQARHRKDFAASDTLRRRIEECGFVVRDTPGGQKVDPL